MSLTYLGRYSFSGAGTKSGEPYASNLKGPACPLMMNAEGKVAIALEAAINGAINLNVQLGIDPPTLAFTLEALVELQAQLDVAIALGQPSVSFSLSAAADLVASLQLALSLMASLELLVNGDHDLFGAGIRTPLPGGPVGTLGGQLTAALATHMPLGGNFLMFVAIDPPYSQLPVPVPPVFAPTMVSDTLKAFLPGIQYGGVLSANDYQFDRLALISTVTADAFVDAIAGINFQLDLALQLQASFNFNPPSLSASVDAAIRFAAFLSAQLELALPRINFALDASAELSASLSARFSAMVNLGAAIKFPLAQFYVYHYSGSLAGIAADVLAELGPAHGNTWGDHSHSNELLGNDYSTVSPLAPVHVAVVGAVNPVDWTAIQTFFAGVFV